VRKEQLLDLTERVSAITGIEIPIIVGSQSIYAATEHVPESVRKSYECDFLLLLVPRSAFTDVMEQVGVASDFQDRTGYHADPVGLATIVLPTGWQERLVPLTNEAGNVQVHCLEVHETCVSKLLAGRDKDFAFIKELLDRSLAEMETFVARRVSVRHAAEQRLAAAPRKA
jgi:hypothetical protein